MRSQLTSLTNKFKDDERMIGLKNKLSETDFGSVFKNVNFWVLVVPVLVCAFYFGVWASERYESRSMLTIQSSGDAPAMDPAMMMLAGVSGGSSTVLDAELVKAYVSSNDMLIHLDQELNIRALYSDKNVDLFSRLSTGASREEFYDFYLSHISADVDAVSGIVTITSQGFNPEAAQLINKAIVNKAEDYINSISRGMATEQLSFMVDESVRALEKLKTEQRKLLAFQRTYGLLDPQAEGLALQQITYGLEAQIASVESQLLTLQQTMTANAPEVLVMESQLHALREQLANERSRLSQSQDSLNLDGSVNLDAGYTSVSEVLADYADLKLSHELALQAYSATQMSIETATVDTYRQAKHLVTLEAPTLPESNRYPEVFYNTLLLFVILLMLNAIIRIIVATVRELG